MKIQHGPTTVSGDKSSLCHWVKAWEGEDTHEPQVRRPALNVKVKVERGYISAEKI